MEITVKQLQEYLKRDDDISSFQIWHGSITLHDINDVQISGHSLPELEELIKPKPLDYLKRIKEWRNNDNKGAEGIDVILKEAEQQGLI